MADEAKIDYEESTGNSLYNSFLVCGSVFECLSRYSPLKPIGKGAYGVVCSARDSESNQKVAIKKIANAFENLVDAKRTLREIKLVRHLNHENVVQIRDLIPPMVHSHFKDLYVVYELMDTDLHQIIRSPQPLSDDHCQYFLYQVLRGLKYIHSAAILHRDLKPSNLLVNANCDLKICDFGLARSTSSSRVEFMTEYVVTRWYRAPELLLSCSEYGTAIDVWSVGCIFAELLGRKPLFPGKDYVHQLNLITRTIGSPSEEELGFISSDKARRYIRSLPRCEPTDFQKLWPNANPKAVDLVKKMLMFDPNKRITVEEALGHEYLATLHDISDEPVCPDPFTFDLESDDLTPDVVRGIILRDMASLHPAQAEGLESAASAIMGGASPSYSQQRAPQVTVSAGSQPASQPLPQASRPPSHQQNGTSGAAQSPTQQHAEHPSSTTPCLQSQHRQHEEQKQDAEASSATPGSAC
uniref:Mitogen-activated protein kinase n=1 Tax=Dunaliella salina TaxID=3046 RepID=I2BK42_DUNSA|nr:mitogen-activated protein kinase [Dunaliella salina]